MEGRRRERIGVYEKRKGKQGFGLLGLEYPSVGPAVGCRFGGNRCFRGKRRKKLGRGSSISI